MQLQFTGELRDSPGVQPDDAFALLPLIAAHIVANTDADPQLLIQLARQRFWLAFAGSTLPPGNSHRPADRCLRRAEPAKCGHFVPE